MPLKSQFSYILRVCIQPGHHEEERMRELIRFCREGLVDDVMFFIDCEDLNQGHITKEEAKPWLNLIARAKEQLEPLEITTSINPWVTLNHADRGRKLKKGQTFGLMVDKNGKEATACVCPLSQEWRNYITDLYSFYASIDPYMLWIEDDFRFHNHVPLEWGGCFCEQHMELYSKKAGKKLSREEFVKGIVRKGEPHPYRKIWLDSARETMVTLAEEIGKAVHQVSPQVRLGLMSSIPAVHCAEGRDWEGILKGLAGETSMVNRPHLPSYQEVSPQSYFWNFNTISVLSKANVPVGTEIYPELENSPRTLFAKSRTFSRFQIELAMALGAQGITMNLFNVMGNGVLMQDGFEKILKEAKPFLNQITALKIEDKQPEGVKVLFDPQSSYTIHTTQGEKMEELYPSENFWAGLLSAYGIATCYSKEKQHQGEVVAISGQYFRNLKENEIKDLLHHNFVLLDGEAVETLFELGYGSFLGIKSMTWYPQYSGDYAYEEVYDGHCYCGIQQARISLQRAEGGFYAIEYEKEPYVITQAKKPNNELIGPSMVVVDEHIFILPSKGKDTFFTIHLDSFKQAIIKSVLQSFPKGKKPAYTMEDPYIGVYTYKGEKEIVLLVANASGDDVDSVSIFVPDLLTNPVDSVRELSRTGCQHVLPKWSPQGEMVLETSLERFEIKGYQIKFDI